MFSADCISCHKIEFWAIERCFSGCLERICITLLSNVAKRRFSTGPDFRRAKVFLRCFFVMERESYSEIKSKATVECVHYIPYAKELALNLIISAEDMRIILSD